MLSVGSTVDIQLHSFTVRENEGCDISLPIDMETCIFVLICGYLWRKFYGMKRMCIL